MKSRTKSKIAAFAIAVVLVAIAAYFAFHEAAERFIDSEKTLITMTTFLSKDDRLAKTKRAIESILSDPYYNSDRFDFVVINEYDSGNIAELEAAYKKDGVRFIQKGREDKGQARSLNMILDTIRETGDRFTYWIHWEETWVLKRPPALKEIISIMRENEKITQLQLTGDWLDMPVSRVTRLPSKSKSSSVEVRVIKPPPNVEYKKYEPRDYETSWITDPGWPLYSLRPSINQASFYRTRGAHLRFPEDDVLWPIKFEWAFAVDWLAAGAMKAVTSPGMAERQPNHKSTY